MMKFSLRKFITWQVKQIQQGGITVLVRKFILFVNLILGNLYRLPLCISAIPVVLVIRLIRPWLLIRWNGMHSNIGHFAANTELYLCERDAGINSPEQTYVDIFYYAHRKVYNKQLEIMWKRILRIWPSWIWGSIALTNRLIPGGRAHEIGHNTQHDRDVHNLLDDFPAHLQFTPVEEARGIAGLRAMGIPIGAPFVCLIVRDSAFHNFAFDSYRDSNIHNYVLAAEELANRGYFVVRMGSKVHSAINSIHPKVIDYATNGTRSDFMDIYLGAKCAFCVSTATGWDAVPLIFRRPIVYVNMSPAGYFQTFRDVFLGIFKHHLDLTSNRKLSLVEIFSRGAGFCVVTPDYESKGVYLIENTPEEIRDVVIEMVERLRGTWQPQKDDEALQRRFWEIFPTDAVDAYQGRPLHAEIRARFGAVFLRNNRSWLE
jgi:putative glycosyltransferase (TIGR04372 family)